VAAAAARVRIVDFFWADPDPALVEVAHRGGALACWQVGSLAAARAAVSAGCDIVAVQGTEAGGHVRGHSPLRPLLESVRGLGDDLSQGGQRVPVPRGYGTPPGAAATGHIDAMPMYAGESVAAITAVEPAAAILEAWSAAL
jgi:NAD(P)H-dependent flavin oxidoreductase YrpB (nitropropane dioxygenase family)